MTTFVLKKYKEATVALPEVDNSKEQKPEVVKKAIIEVDGSISEIVATALNKVLTNNITLELEEDTNTEEVTASAVSTESINRDPVNTLRGVKPNLPLLIYTKEGFHTEKEDWFLLNVAKKTNSTCYSVEGFVRQIMESLA